MGSKRYAILLPVIVLICGWYGWRFYPRQQMPVGTPVAVLTPEFEIYRNDCLHPCIRPVGDGYVMAYSPYYKWNSRIENPIVSFSDSFTDWNHGVVLDDTPETGFNSDPNVFVSDSVVYAFWRVCGTPLCSELDKGEVVIGRKVSSADAGNEADNQVYISNAWPQGDVTQCPILMEHDGKYLFYAVWYAYEPERVNKGIAIWEGTSLEHPDFVLRDTVRFDNPLVCDKYVQKKIGRRIWFVPVPKRYDLWHFDLFEYHGNLYMVSCAEKDDNIMLSVSEDWIHFRTMRTPLVNNHCSENHTGYRQYYYKPTALVRQDTLVLFYTANSQDDPDRNQLFMSMMKMPENR